MQKRLEAASLLAEVHSYYRKGDEFESLRGFLRDYGTCTIRASLSDAVEWLFCLLVIHDTVPRAVRDAYGRMQCDLTRG